MDVERVSYHTRKATHLSAQTPPLRGRWPHKYKFGDKGSILRVVNDEDTDDVRYSLDLGKSRYVRFPHLLSYQKPTFPTGWHWHQIPTEGTHDSPRLGLVQVPTSGQVARKVQRPHTKNIGRVLIIQLDFCGTKCNCVEETLRNGMHALLRQCLMGHKVRITHFTPCGFS